MFKFIKKENIAKLPQVSGVYAFKKGQEFLYIGKAINIRERVRNHFNQPVFKDTIFIPQTEKIGYIETNSEIEALLLEAELIKKRQPQYNQQWKDSKNYFYVAISKEDFPRIFVTHQIKSQNQNIGPFVDGAAIKQALRVLRRVFPFRSCRKMPKKPCLYYDLKVCNAPCLASYLDKKDYKKNINNLIKVLRGKKTQVIKDLKRQMEKASQNQEFEKAKELRDQIKSLESVFTHSHILQGVKLLAEKEFNSFDRVERELRKLLGIKRPIQRIEGYDISNIQGKLAVGSMVVFEKGLADKSQYRKFKIKMENEPNDTAMIKEVLGRRLRHQEWPLPEIMLIDGGRGQLNAAMSVLPSKINIAIIALAKKNNELFIEKREKPVLLKDLAQETANLILRVRDEAHRFAISYHKTLRSKNFVS